MPKEFYGKYRARVVDLNDPEERGRIRVECPKIYGTSKSPWCLPCVSNAGDYHGDFCLPQINETVWIEFESGDVCYPVYTGNWYSRRKTPLSIFFDYSDAAKKRLIGFKNTFFILGEDSITLRVGNYSVVFNSDLISKLQGYAFNPSTSLSLKKEGCKGDGTTDDTTALRACIAKAIIEGKSVYIDPGVYRFTERITISSPLVIHGGNHDTSILFFDGVKHTETQYDDEWWEESSAAILVKANNVTLENFILKGGEDKYHASECNGIIFHYTKADGTAYDASQRTILRNIDVKCFKNGVFSYAGWNRMYMGCYFYDNTFAGLKYYPLEPAKVGNWSGSGDSILSCQFVGNLVAGFHATGLYDTSLFDAKFEYNDRAILADKCNDITFFNCWNEANTNFISVTGCARFQGGYNITPSTLTHTKDSVNDIVIFEGKASTYIVSGTENRFIQTGGIITKGVSLASEIINLVQNPYFVSSGSPSMSSWDLYTAWATTAVSDVLYDGHNTAHFLVSGGGESYFGFRQPINVELGKSYQVSFQVMSPDRSTIDGQGLCVYIAHRNPAGEVSWNDNRFFTLISDNVWETKTFTFTPAGDDASIVLGFGCYQNGNVYFANPSFVDSESLGDTTINVKKKDDNTLSFIDALGAEVGTAPTNPATKQDVAITGLHSNTVEGQLGYLESSLSAKADSALIGVNSGIAQLDSAGHVPASQLPSFVNDVLEYANLSALPATGEAGIIYVTLDTNKTYRWTGTVYTEISKSIAIGETSDTAFAGDRGKTLETQMSNILNLVYPVGCLYWSSVSTSPATLFGGTWTQIKDKFILAAGDTYALGATGGAATVTLSNGQIPLYNLWMSSNSFTPGLSIAVNGGSAYGLATQNAGGGEPHNNMPPYKVCYCWERTA